ncbi:hypothetical protein [Sphaerisporangium dianthi]|uniref:Uncharacterized protein n=1 Tax=Sphaerisporangium dianthi TaxID=1436120 RepID=A0ABV9CF17_9ACTN
MTHGQTTGKRSSETQILRDALTLPIRMSIVWSAPRSSDELIFVSTEPA